MSPRAATRRAVTGVAAMLGVGRNARVGRAGDRVSYSDHRYLNSLGRPRSRAGVRFSITAIGL
jgi:hypothetical protein